MEYRLKYNIPFGSPEHRASNFISMAIDLTEKKLIDEYIQELNDKENNINASGLSSTKMKQSEIDEEFENLNLEDFNDVE